MPPEGGELAGRLQQLAPARASFPGGRPPRRSGSRLRFLDRAALGIALAEAGLVIEEQFGDLRGGPLTEASPAIVTVARG